MSFMKSLGKVLNGLVANDGTGDSLRGGASTINANWDVIVQAVNALAASQGTGVVVYTTKATMLADTGRPAGTGAWVLNDPTPTNNTSYGWDGAAWTQAYDRLTFALGNGSGFQAAPSGALLRTLQDDIRDKGIYLTQLSGGDKTGTVDATSALQGAINYVLGLAQASGKAYGLPPIVLPGGSYRFTSTITTYPFITVVFLGSALLDFTGLPGASHAFVCKGASSPASDLLKQPANSAPWLCGNQGAVAILGPGRASSSTSAIHVGNDVSGLSDVRDAYIENVVVTGFSTAIDFGKFNTYLCGARKCRFESNTVNVSTPSGSVTNSGERITFDSCTFSGATSAHVIHQTSGGFDLNFRNCSFDFSNGDVIQANGSSFASITLDAACHFEAFDGYLTNVSSPGSGFGIWFGGISSLLPRDYANTAGVNSPSRPLINSTGSTAWVLSLGDVIARYEAMPYLFDAAMVTGSNVQVSCQGQGASGYALPVTNAYIANTDYKFQSQASGDALPLHHWSATASSGLTGTPALVTSGSGLALSVTSSGSTPSFTMLSDCKFPVRAGERWRANASISIGTATGAVNVTPDIVFYDIAGAQITTTSLASISAATYFSNTSAPNYASGNSRMIDLHGQSKIAPAGAVSAAVRVSLGSFTGTVLVGACRAWRA